MRVFRWLLPVPLSSFERLQFFLVVARHVLCRFKSDLQQRCQAVGLPTEVVERLDLRGSSTFANFAHAPTATQDTAGAEAAQEAALRQLHWEAWTLTAADLKRKVDGTTMLGPGKLPVTEISARL